MPRPSSIALFGALFATSCGDRSPPPLQLISPAELHHARVVAVSDAVLIVSLGPGPSNKNTRLLNPVTFAKFADVPGEPVWAGRTTWGETILRVPADASSPDLTSSQSLVRADGADRLVLTPPEATGWRFAFSECGDAWCSVTWTHDNGKQFVDLVSAVSLTKEGSYARDNPARSGVVDPFRPVAYHLDEALRLVAEDQKTGKTLWATAVDKPVGAPSFNVSEFQILVTGRGRYVLVVHDQTGAPKELNVYDAANGKKLAIDHAKFRSFTADAVEFAAVPKSDGLLITTYEHVGSGAILTMEGGGGHRGLASITEVSIPGLAVVAARPARKGAEWSGGKVVATPLASGKVLISASH